MSYGRLLWGKMLMGASWEKKRPKHCEGDICLRIPYISHYNQCSTITQEEFVRLMKNAIRAKLYSYGLLKWSWDSEETKDFLVCDMTDVQYEWATYRIQTSDYKLWEMYRIWIDSIEDKRSKREIYKDMFNINV